jgi:hypothetical protein
MFTLQVALWVQKTGRTHNHSPDCHYRPQSCALPQLRHWGLEGGLAIGIALVSCMPGGTASNIVAYIARVGDNRASTRTCR